MRLGDYPAKLKKSSKTYAVYRDGAFKKDPKFNGNIIERHRHRYEVNQKYLKAISKGGIEVSGTSPDGKLVEFIEAPKCKFFMATQAHPEFKSRPLDVHPLFMKFVESLL